MTQWEYCILTQAPSGPLLITLTRYTPDGGKSIQHRADSYEAGLNQLWPQLVAELGRDGWELVAIETGAWYFKRPLQER